ncbi:MAG TPA: hypothetical protein VKK30_01645, partial [Actinomycetota bacterium]|nr:hypothetical protein [Actinomycetota bacterium]
VLGAAVLFFLLWRHAEGTNSSADREQGDVTHTATEFLNTLTNFKGTTIDQDVAQIKRFAIGDFAGQVDTFFGPTNRDALRKAQAESVGHVESVFVESLQGDQASIFAVVSETITNVSTTTPKAQTLRIDMGMIDTSSGWKVNRVDILQSPGNPSIPGAGA